MQIVVGRHIVIVNLLFQQPSDHSKNNVHKIIPNINKTKLFTRFYDLLPFVLTIKCVYFLKIS